MTEVILSARAVGKSFGRTPALCGVSLELPRGEELAVTGPSGSGESTLLHWREASHRRLPWSPAWTRLKETALAAGAGAVGVTALDAAEAGPVPTALVATTWSVTASQS